MTKKRLFNAAAITAALTLITACMLGGTFAKYTTSDTGSDSARVAMFGVEINADLNGFSAVYRKDDERTMAPALNQTVESNVKVVAPGTRGDFGRSSVSGIPEVGVEINRTADLTLSGWEYKYVEDGVTQSDYYCPLVIRIANTYVRGMDYESMEEFEAAVEAAISQEAPKYPAGWDISENELGNLSWEWPFSSANNANDPKDTYLGNLAALGEGPTIDLVITTSVTQID